MEQGGQVKKVMGRPSGPGRGWELVVPNPKLKLMDQAREVLRIKHYAIRTEQAYCDWIKRYVHFHGMRCREDLFPGAEKVELFLSDLAVNGHVAAATQNQAFNALLFLYSQELLGHNDVFTTMIYTHVLRQGRHRIKSPLDCLQGSLKSKGQSPKRLRGGGKKLMVGGVEG